MKLHRPYIKPEIKKSLLGIELRLEALTRDQLILAICETEQAHYQVNSDLIAGTAEHRVALTDRTLLLSPKEAAAVVEDILSSTQKLAWAPRIRMLRQLKQAELVDKLQAVSPKRLYYRYGTKLEERELRLRMIRQPDHTLEDDREIVIDDKRRLGRAHKVTKQEVEEANRQYRARKRREAKRKAFRKANKITGRAYVAMLRKHNRYLHHNPDKGNF
jgi:hypothetical protein